MKYGFLPDPVNAYDKRTQALRYSRGVEPRIPSLSMLDKISPAYDQLSTSSCVGFALKRAIQLQLKTEVSARGIYTVALCLDRDDPRSPLIDKGSRPLLAVEGLHSWGVASERAWPFSVDSITRVPDFLTLRRISAVRVTGWARILEEGQAKIDEYVSAIDNGFPVVFAMSVNKRYEDYQSGVLGPLTGPMLGGHYQCLVGYEIISGKKVFYVSNSWGSSWGENGIATVNEDFMLQTHTGYICDIQFVRQ